MKRKSRVLSLLISVCMLVTMLPTQFVSAADVPEATISYVNSMADLETNHYSGAYMRLEKAAAGAKYDYAVTMGLYGIENTYTFGHGLSFDTSKVRFCDSGGYIYKSGAINPSKNPYWTVCEAKESWGPGYEDDRGNAQEVVGSLLDFDMTMPSYKVGEDGTIDTTGIDTITIFSSMNNENDAVDAWATNWTNADSGAQASTIVRMGTDVAVWKSPPGEGVDLYTLYFKKTNADDDLDNDDAVFSAGHAGYSYTGGGYTADGYDATLSHGVCFVGFPAPTPVVETKTVSFRNIHNDSNQTLNGTIEIYTDSNRTDKACDITLTNGEATAELESGKTYYYTIKVNGYSDLNGTFTMEAGSGAEVTNKTVSKNTRSVTITVIDADTAATVSGATVTFDNVSSDTETTNTNGQATRNMETGRTYTVSASCAGYDSASQNITVNTTGSTEWTIKITKTRQAVTLPEVKLEGGATPSKPSILVKNVSDEPRNEWSPSGTKIYTSQEEVQLPKDTKYEVTVSATGGVGTTYYMWIKEDGNIEYYSDDEFSQPMADFDGSQFELPAMEDPYYEMVVTRNETNPKEFTADVTLYNIKDAVYGTFGIRYDNSVFNFGGFELDTTVKELNPGEAVIMAGYDFDDNTELDDIAQSNDANEQTGYYVFTWKSPNNDFATGVDATSGLHIGTFTLTMKDGKSENDITTDSFSVMPFDKTAAAVEYAKDSKTTEDKDAVFSPLWRYCDEDNVPSAETGKVDVECRIDQKDAILDGFYQIYVVTNGMPSYKTTHDVKTIIQYPDDIEVKQRSIDFVVTDKKTGEPLPNATAKLYDMEGNEVATLVTDGSGIVTYPIRNTVEEHYKYVVSCNGYWPQPKDGVPAEITVDTINTTVVQAPLLKRVYHMADLKDKTDSELPDLELTNDIAYNDIDYHFNIVPVKGKKFPDGTDLKNLDIRVIVDGEPIQAEYDPKTNTYVVPGDKITGDPAPDATPDENGYPAGNITVQLRTPLEVEDDDTTHLVTAVAGENGYVTYTKTEEQQDIDETKSTKIDGQDDQYSKITLAEFPLIDAKPVGTFTFTADPGFKVEKVFVNGVEAAVDKGADTFEYTFTDTSVNNNITVTFWDELHPSDDTVMTLVVGDNGYVALKDAATDHITSETRVYLMKEADTGLEFTVTPESGYKSVVRKSVNDGEIEDITSGTNYKIDKPDVTKGEKNITVYVTFPDQETDETTDVVVTSYIKEGKGTVEPMGIFTINKYTNFKITMTAAEDSADWSAYGVDVNGAEIKNTTTDRKTYTHEVQNIVTDTRIGAIFREKTCSVTGHVDLSQNSNLTDRGVLTGAVVVCERKEDGYKTNPVTTTISRHNAIFNVELSQGTWSITVSKPGYITYTVTDFVIGADDDEKVFGETADKKINKITPYIGNTTGTGRTISLMDLGNISNSLRANAHESVKLQGDVNNDSVNNLADITYAMRNYGQRVVEETYNTFMTTKINYVQDGEN